jgi:hypothetical protein
MFVVMAMVMVMAIVLMSDAHLAPSLSPVFSISFEFSRVQTGSSQCSGDSVCSVSLSNGYSSHKSF